MDEKLLLAVMDKFDKSGIVELELDEGNLRLALRKGQRRREGGVGSREERTETRESEAVSSSVPTTQTQASEPQTPSSSDTEIITSPIVATYHANPSPDSPAFVSVGDTVKAGDTLCILEAMKMMNHLDAEFDCEILKTHARAGDFVEYGQPLFTVKRL
jgi:acetyl-CoA carboxylase biotin carboxyl carrier protein